MRRDKLRRALGGAETRKDTPETKNTIFGPLPSDQKTINMYLQNTIMMGLRPLSGRKPIDSLVCVYIRDTFRSLGTGPKTVFYLRCVFPSFRAAKGSTKPASSQAKNQVLHDVTSPMLQDSTSRQVSLTAASVPCQALALITTRHNAHRAAPPATVVEHCNSRCSPFVLRGLADDTLSKKLRKYLEGILGAPLLPVDAAQLPEK